MLQFGKTQIEFLHGDITGVRADALVNAANNRLLMGAGVAGALKRKGGREIEEEGVKRGPIPIGEALATGAGRLPARYVIHAAVMGMDFRTDEGKIREATRNSLRRAEELGLHSIVFPALGTGVGGFPQERCARIMLEEARGHLQGGSGLERVVFVLWEEEAYEAWRRVARGFAAPQKP